jgi:hypothetical protein
MVLVWVEPIKKRELREARILLKILVLDLHTDGFFHLTGNEVPYREFEPRFRGKVFSQSEFMAIAELCEEYGFIVRRKPATHISIDRDNTHMFIARNTLNETKTCIHLTCFTVKQ